MRVKVKIIFLIYWCKRSQL